MTRLQKEVNRLLPQADCTGRYDEETESLYIDYEGSELLSLHAKGSIYYDSKKLKTNERNNQFFSIKDLIGHVVEYLNAYESSPLLEALGLEERWRRLAEYNKIVLAARDDGDYGFTFTTWKKSFDGKSVVNGHYTMDYTAAKRDFAARSGLINKNRLFDNEQLKNILYCLVFTNQNDKKLTDDQLQTLKEFAIQISEFLPDALKEQEPNEFPQQNM